MRIAMVGTRGVPARYGGFETCVEEVGSRLVRRGHEVIVYCRTAGDDRPSTHLGMRLVHLPALRTRSLETLSHTALSVLHLLRWRADAVVLFNAANAPFLPLLRLNGLPVATHVDGLEWKRAKWSGAGRRYYRAAEALAVRWSDALVADATGIATYYADEFGAVCERITYGAPLISVGHDRVRGLGLQPGAYHLVVARMEPENHVDVIVDGYRRSDARLPLVVVGSAPYADRYRQRVTELADERVRLLGGLWDQDLLDELYGNALTYFHGHSVGGTNPSLLRAVGAGAATNAFDVGFNREVLGVEGRYWSDGDEVADLVSSAEADPEATLARGKRTTARAAEYDWDDVTEGYERLCARLPRLRRRRRPTGVRRGRAPGRVEVTP
jgi:glycosyltransferase involved in cell wall biosynthesis